MSALETCTDALLQQKVVQASNYERLESRLMEMERTKRSLFFGLKEIITDVERRRQDLGELREESARLQQQLQQGSMKFGALASLMGEEQKKLARLQEALESCATAWTGCPARVAFLVRALQERNDFSRQMKEVFTVLTRVGGLVEVVRRVDAGRGILKERLNCLDAEAERLEGVLQKCHMEQSTSQEELRRREEAARADILHAWRDSQEKERQLLMAEAELTEAQLSFSANEGLNAIFRMALQTALSISDSYSVRRDRMAVVARFNECCCILGQENIAGVEMQRNMMIHVLKERLATVTKEREHAVSQRERALRETALLRKKQEVQHGAVATLEHRVQSLQLASAAIRVFRRQQHARLLRVCSERAEREAALMSARTAHESRVAARRLRALQQEAREGVAAEESILRGSLVATEDEVRREMHERQQQSFVVLARRAEEEKQEKKREEEERANAAARLPQQQQQSQPVRNSAGKRDGDGSQMYTTRNTPPKKTATTRRGRPANNAPQTEKKRPRSNTDLVPAIATRRTHPESRQQYRHNNNNNNNNNNNGDDDGSSDSSVTSLGDILTLGTRVPLSALKSSGHRHPLQSLPVNVNTSKSGSKQKSGSGRKHDGSSKGLADAAARRFHMNSPLPRPPGSGDAPSALSSALFTAAVRTGDSGEVEGTAHSAKSKGRHQAPRPRPLVLVSKDAWNEGKTDDIFADVFSF